MLLTFQIFLGVFLALALYHICDILVASWYLKRQQEKLTDVAVFPDSIKKDSKYKLQ